MHSKSVNHVPGLKCKPCAKLHMLGGFFVWRGGDKFERGLAPPLATHSPLDKGGEGYGLSWTNFKGSEAKRGSQR